MTSFEANSWEFDVYVKTIIVGDSSVGKSCLLNRYTDDQFDPTTESTIGVGLRLINQNIERTDVNGRTQTLRAKIQLWDTAGQERFKSITAGYYRGAHGILVVFDKTNEKSFENVTQWMKEIEFHASEKVQLILVGNKSDLVARCVVDYERAELLAREYGIPYIETSAKSGDNVDDAFTTILKNVVESSTFLSHQVRGEVVPDPTPVQTSTGCCRIA